MWLLLDLPASTSYVWGFGAGGAASAAFLSESLNPVINVPTQPFGNTIVIPSSQATPPAYASLQRKFGNPNLAVEARCAVEMPWCHLHYSYANRKEHISHLVSLKVRESCHIRQEGKEEHFRRAVSVPSTAAGVILFPTNSH